MQAKYKNRIYASWRNIKGIDCKMIGPATKCFCDHRFKDHEFLNPKDKKGIFMPLVKNLLQTNFFT